MKYEHRGVIVDGILRQLTPSPRVLVKLPANVRAFGPKNAGFQNVARWQSKRLGGQEKWFAAGALLANGKRYTDEKKGTVVARDGQSLDGP